jgi:phospholipase A1
LVEELEPVDFYRYLSDEIDPHFTVQAKFWIPFALSDNPHIVRYAGYGQVAGTYKTRNERFRFSMLVVKRGGWNLNANFQMDAAFRLSKISNQYIYLQYYNGYAESMIDYDRFHSYLRIGFAIKPKHFSIF